MEKRTCKLCFKSFSNGRALGGHMRSHMATLQTPSPPSHHPKTQLSQQFGEETESASSTSSSSSEEEEEEKELGYGLRENPKKSFRLVDPEFSFVVDAGSVVQDRESETESSKNPFRRRSKRNRKSGFAGQHQQRQKHEPELKKPKSSKFNKVESLIEPEPVSSVSDTSPEEDLALCLMMLSRGVWVRKKENEEEEVEVEEDEEEEEEEEEQEEEETEKSIEETDEESKELKFRPSRNRGKYQCGTCKKVFRSYQALGGHRASHKKIRSCNTQSSSFVAPITHEADYEPGSNAVAVADVVVDRRIHECPICFRIFGSGQALGGHKRSHVSGSATTTTNTNTNKSTNFAKFGDNLIDLNLPAPVDDDDISQIELSAVSDAEFFDPIK